LIAMETPLNTERFFEPFDFTRVAETWRQVRKCLSLSAFRSGGRVARALHLPHGDVENERKVSTMKTKIGLIAIVLFVSLHAPQTFAQLQRPLAGSTLGQSLRNAATLTLNQSAGLRMFVDDWSGHARAGIYTDANFRHDYATALARFVALRTQFNYAGELALQLGRPGANDAVAELDEGLDVIGEPFAFLQKQYNAGTLDRVTVLRTVAALQKALREWEYELRRNSSRLGVIR